MSELAEHCSGKKCWWPGSTATAATKNRSKHSNRLQAVHIQAENRHCNKQKHSPLTGCERGTESNRHLAPIRTPRNVGVSSSALASSLRWSLQPSLRNHYSKVHPSSIASTASRDTSWREVAKTNRHQVTVSVNICPGPIMATSKDDDEAESDHVANKRSSSSESSDSSEQGSESSSEPGSISAPPTLPIQRPSLSLRWDSIDTDEPKCRDFGIRDYLTATNESLDAEEESSMAGDFNTGLGVPPPRFSIDSLDATTALLLDTHVKDRNQHDHDRLASSGRAPKSLRKSLSLPHAAASFSPNLPKIHEIQKIAVAKPPEDSSSHQQPIELLDMDTIRSQKRRVTVDLNTSGRRCGTWEG